MSDEEPDNYRVTLAGRYLRCETCAMPDDIPARHGLTIVSGPDGRPWPTPHREGCTTWAREGVSVP